MNKPCESLSWKCEKLFMKSDLTSSTSFLAETRLMVYGIAGRQLDGRPGGYDFLVELGGEAQTLQSCMHWAWESSQQPAQRNNGTPAGIVGRQIGKNIFLATLTYVFLKLENLCKSGIAQNSTTRKQENSGSFSLRRIAKTLEENRQRACQNWKRNVFMQNSQLQSVPAEILVDRFPAGCLSWPAIGGNIFLTTWTKDVFLKLWKVCPNVLEFQSFLHKLADTMRKLSWEFQLKRASRSKTQTGLFTAESLPKNWTILGILETKKNSL